MAGNSPLYYWDSCLFIAWLKDEQRKTGDMDGVREVIEQAKRREVKLMTSVLTLTEVLSSKIPIGIDTLFANLLKRISKQGIDIKIATLVCMTSAISTYRRRLSTKGKPSQPRMRFIWQPRSFAALMNFTRLMKATAGTASAYCPLRATSLAIT